MCPGINHESAPELDAEAAGEMLRLATEQLAGLQAAAALGSQQRRRERGAQQHAGGS